MSDLMHVVGFSGGADSQAAALWVRRRFPPEQVILLNTLAGRNEHPVTEQFIHQYSETVFPVVTVTPLIKDLMGRGTRPGQARDRRQEFDDEDELTFQRLAYIKGRFPSRKAQFCTEHLKLRPQARWCEENLEAKGIDYERYTGVRQDESHKRKDTVEREWDDYFDCYVNHPLATWTKKQVFDYILEAGEQFNPLYLQGFGRVGCAPCVNSGKDDINLWATRYPEMIDKLRGWEKQNGRTFFPPMVPGMEMNFVDEVVAWSKTAYGGNQILLPMLEAEVEEGSCSSRYGLCE